MAREKCFQKILYIISLVSWAYEESVLFWKTVYNCVLWLLNYLTFPIACETLQVWDRSCLIHA